MFDIVYGCKETYWQCQIMAEQEKFCIKAKNIQLCLDFS